MYTHTCMYTRAHSIIKCPCPCTKGRRLMTRALHTNPCLSWTSCLFPAVHQHRAARWAWPASFLPVSSLTSEAACGALRMTQDPYGGGGGRVLKGWGHVAPRTWASFPGSQRYDVSPIAWISGLRSSSAAWLLCSHSGSAWHWGHLLPRAWVRSAVLP